MGREFAGGSYLPLRHRRRPGRADGGFAAVWMFGSGLGIGVTGKSCEDMEHSVRSQYQDLTDFLETEPLPVKAVRCAGGHGGPAERAALQNDVEPGGVHTRGF